MQDLTEGLVKVSETVWGYLALPLLAVWGGTVNYISSLGKDGKKFSWKALIAEWTVSGFAGLLVSLIGMEMQWSMYVIAFMAGMAGHMGGRALFVLETLFKARLGSK